MAQVKLTKNELKRQKDALKMFQRYLPTLILKKQQLETVLRQIEHQRQILMENRAERWRELSGWIQVFGEPVDLTQFVQVDRVETGTGNIAGIDIPVFTDLTYREADYDLFLQPLWVDRAIEQLKRILRHDAEIAVLNEQSRLIAAELRVTSQRVNLFEKVKIPETKEAIRRIQIYLGDQQTAAVVRGKIAKNKLRQEEQA